MAAKPKKPNPAPKRQQNQSRQEGEWLCSEVQITGIPKPKKNRESYIEAPVEPD